MAGEFCREHKSARAVVGTATAFLSLLMALLGYLFLEAKASMIDAIAESATRTARIEAAASLHVTRPEQDRLAAALEGQGQALADIKARLQTQEALLSRTESTMLRLEARLIK